MANLDPLVLPATHQEYQRSAEFGRRSLLGLRVRTRESAEPGRPYREFSSEKALAHSKRIAGHRHLRTTLGKLDVVGTDEVQAAGCTTTSATAMS